MIGRGCHDLSRLAGWAQIACAVALVGCLDARPVDGVKAIIGPDGPMHIGAPVIADRPNDALVWTSCLADRAQLAHCVGVVVAIDADGGVEQGEGAVEISAVDWAFALDGPGPLVTANIYYASDETPGHLTPTRPTTPGHYATQIGFALSPTKLQLQISSPTEIVP